jgi:glycosyltransferase involved in cell wall biosynthesis
VKLLYILENYWPHVGGMERLMGEICERMARHDHDVTVLTRSLPDAPRAEVRRGVKIVRVRSPAGRFAFPLVAIPAALRLGRHCDLIHTTTFSAAPLASLIARIVAKPVILTVPELWVGRWRAFSDAPLAARALYDAVERLIFTLPFDAYVGISRFTSGRLQSYLGCQGRKVRTIYCGFDPTPWKGPVDKVAMRESFGVAGHEFLIVGYGRPGMSKGFRYLADAFARIAENIPNARLLLILSDSSATARELARIKRRADRRIIFERPLPFEKLSKIVASADCIVIPSLAEGFGYTTLEAATTGVPFVVSDTTSIPEVVGGRYALAEPRDVDSIARAVERIHSGIYIERTIPEFDWDRTIAAYEDLYRRALHLRDDPQR